MELADRTDLQATRRPKAQLKANQQPGGGLQLNSVTKWVVAVYGVTVVANLV